MISRPAGREAYLALLAYLVKDIKKDEKIIIDFEGVKVLTPSWADEVIPQLAKNYRIAFDHADNPTVQATLKTLAEYSDLVVEEKHV